MERSQFAYENRMTPQRISVARLSAGMDCPWGGPTTVASIFQRAAGNRWVGVIIQRHAVSIQPQLTVSQLGDIYDQEADRGAEEVMRTNEPSQPVCAPSPNWLIRRGDGDSPAYATPTVVDEAIRSDGGQSLDQATRAFFEPRFGYDFSQVRIHTGAEAAASAQAVNALAFTVGRHIVFGAGQYAPGTDAGQRLLAHELTHVIQQASASRAIPSSNRPRLQRQTPPAGTRPNTPWHDLSASAQAALQTSFNSRTDRKLEWIWWLGNTAEACFNTMEPERQSAFRAVYQALSDADLWREVVRVLEVFPRGTRGIKAIAKNSLMERLVFDRRFCMDTPLGGAQHSNAAMWRQVVRAGTQGLHIGVSRQGRMTAHLDTIAPVVGREANGQCRYSMPHLVPHAIRDLKGWRYLELFPTPVDEPRSGEVQPMVRFRIPGT